MPELPEAETIVEGLRGPVVGRSFTLVQVLRGDLLSTSAANFSRTLSGGIVGRIFRRGKNVVLRIQLQSGPRPEAVLLVVNLGMSGRLLHRAHADRSSPPSHPGVRFHLDDRSLLVYHDVRRFGRLTLMTPTDYRTWSRVMGPEPLSPSFTERGLTGALARSRSPIRSWLLDQRRIAGVGNIYANEALWRAGIHPKRPAREVTPEEGRRLHRALRKVLRAAVAARGTTLRDYRTAEGWEGSYASELRVYSRQGNPCERCGSTIERLSFGGRSAFFCPTCQPSTGIRA